MLIEMALNNHLSQELSLSLSAPPAAAAVLECISFVSSITELILLHYRTRLTFPFLPMPGRIGQIELKDRWDISEDEEEERRRPGIDALESAVHEEALEEMTRKGMIGQRDLD